MTSDASGKNKVSRTVQIGLGSVATVIGIATGVFTLWDKIFPPDHPASVNTRSVPYFDRVVGHLEPSSKKFIGFLRIMTAIQLNCR
jgi:hypothetical protein